MLRMKGYITPEEAGEQQLEVDTTVYPNVAYRGPRFKPTRMVNVHTVMEADLLQLIERINGHLDDEATGRTETSCVPAEIRVEIAMFLPDITDPNGFDRLNNIEGIDPVEEFDG